MAQFTIYKSTDGSAPVLSGTTGSLVALLDSCLVTGYGAKPAAGWTKPFTAASKAVLRPNSGTRFFLRIQDDGPGVGTFKEARITGYETMTDVDTGVNPFPTAAQGVGGIAMVVARKSTTADATARPWVVVADSRTLYVFVLTGDSAGVYFAFSFGDFYSFVAADLYNCMIVGRNAENNGGITTETLDLVSSNAGGALAATTAAHFFARAHTGLGTSVLCGVHSGDQAKKATSTVIADPNTSMMPLPNLPDGGMYFARVWVHDPVTAPLYTVRGRMRGFWDYCGDNGGTAFGFADLSTLSGTGDLAGRSFLFLKRGGNSGTRGSMYTIETSDTLETN